MAEFVNEHIGNQLQVSTGAAGNEGSPLLPERDPLCLGIGPSAIPGSIFASGCELIGNPLSYPLAAQPEAALMVSIPNAKTNPLAAKTKSIFKVTTKANRGPTPIDVVLGDRGAGPVGIRVSSLVIDILNNTEIKIVSPKLKLIGEKKHVGMNIKTGTEIRTGACNETGFKSRSGFHRQFSGGTNSTFLKVPRVEGKIFTGKALIDKAFDIAHPTREGKRIRHICVEGPESAIYIRGKLEDSKIIELPEYWDGLVDYESITVTLTAVGKPQHLYVKSIDKDEIMIDNRKGDECLPSCYYEVWGNRIGPELVVEYEGESPADYPGDQSGHSIAGYNYDTREDH
tara:strand:+ start:119 stop:1144 length:1026 start_codon:yes stop_codon:yes gene_type:complete